MSWHRKASAKTQVSLRKFLQSEVKIIVHIIVQNNIYYSARSRWTKQQHSLISLANEWADHERLAWEAIKRD